MQTNAADISWSRTASSHATPIATRTRGGGDDRRLIESVRVVLATVAGLLMLDAGEAAQGRLALAVLAYGIYAGTLLWQAANGSRGPRARILHWLDAVWFLLLIAMAGEAGMRYFLFLFFPVLFAAWRRGIRESIAVAAVCGMGALAIFSWNAPALPWPRLLALPLSLLITGPLVAVLARAEASAQHGLVFAAQLVESIDPRRGFDALAPLVLERVARHFGATSAVLAVRPFESNPQALCWEAGRGTAALSEAAASAAVERLLALPPGLAALFMPGSGWRAEKLVALSVTGAGLATVSPERAPLAALAEFIGESRVMSAPMPCRSLGSVRLVLAGGTIGTQAAMLEVLIQVTEQLGPVLENAYLLERLASEAVDTERARIGRDLHDSAIQPYIGLKFALEGLVRRAGPDNPLADDLQRLLDMTVDELAAMREVVSGLRGTPGKGGALLASAVQRQAARFAQLFGIEVQVAIEGKLPVSRRLAGELFHLVAEGLSNIRRHTRARQAWIELACEGDSLVLSIRNEHGAGRQPGHFMPRSLSERAEALGGAAEVQIDASGTTLCVVVPLSTRKQGDPR